VSMNIDIKVAEISDFAIDFHGTIAVLWPQSGDAFEWVNENIDPDATHWGKNGTVIEHRYLGDIVNAIHDAGFTIKDVIDTRVRT